MPNNDFLYKLLEMNYIPTVIDIGANPLDGGDPPYKSLLESGLCQLIGFEPQENALQALLSRKSDYESYYQYAIGDGNVKTLYICEASGMTSTLKPNKKNLNLFNEFSTLGSVKEQTKIKTTRLDEIKEIEKIDYLKFDVQGAELEIFESGKEHLKNTVVIQTEVSFISLYETQPSFGEIDLYLRSLGFIPHAMSEVKRWPLSPLVINGNSRHALNQVLEADIVYVRDFTDLDSMNPEQWKTLILIAHYCYSSYDLALRSIMNCEKKGYLPLGSAKKYLEKVNSSIKKH